MAYPKMMFHPDGTEVLCKQSVHEADLLAAGFRAEPTLKAKSAPREAVEDSPAPESAPVTPARRGRKAKG